MLNDTKLIEKAIQYVFSNSLATILRDKDILRTVTVVTFDDHNLYTYKNINSDIIISKIPHNEEILNKTKRGWSAYLRQSKDLKKYFLKAYRNHNIISGGSYSDFSKLQKKIGTIYTNQESYIATIIHEYAHVYFNNSNPFYYSNRKEVINIIDSSINLYKAKKSNLMQNFFIPSYKDFSELFAFCTEYEFSKRHAPIHFSLMNKEITKSLQKYLDEERKKDLKKEDSILQDSHIFSWVFGKILMEKYPKKWHEILLKNFFI